MSSERRSRTYPVPTAEIVDVLRDIAACAPRPEEDAPSPEQIEIYRRMTPGRRLEVAEQLYWSARRMKAAWLKSQHPDWTESQVEAEVKSNFSNARS